MPIQDQRIEISPQKYKYLLIINNTRHWLTINKLAKRKEAVLTSTGISLRLSNMFNDSKFSNFKTVLECISRPSERRSRSEGVIDTSEAIKLMNQSLLERR